MCREMSFVGGSPGTTDTLAEGAEVESLPEATLPGDVQRSVARTPAGARAIAFEWGGMIRVAIVGHDVEFVPRTVRVRR